MERAAVPSMIREQRLNQWIEDYSDSILRTCFLYLSDQTQAEDATQDTWIKAWKHAHSNQYLQGLPAYSLVQACGSEQSAG